MPGQRANAGGRLVLELNGDTAGFVKSFSGLAMEAEIVSDDLQKKHVARVRSTPGKATIGIPMGNECYQWVRGAFEKGVVTRSGSLTAADVNDKTLSVATFKDALITRVTVPKLDGSSKEVGYFDLEFEAEQIQWSAGRGEVIGGTVGLRQKAWLCSNFRVEMGGLPCSRVISVDAFTWLCTVDSDQPGITREPTKHPAKVTVPDIKLSISMADYPTWADAARKWFVDGQHLEQNEMQGSITFLEPGMKGEIGGIDLVNCGFKKFSQDNFDPNSDRIAGFNVELYVEKMAFKLNAPDERT